ncbi:MAG: DUF4190 domain-containing protein [Desulfobacterales bacterium]|nr:DUF4190 domain-containing protein [Desulfobacterales bacterium]
MERDVSKKQTSKHAVASLILAVFGIFLFLPMPAAMVLGHVGRSKCKEDPGLGGKWLATFALVIGYLYFAIVIACVCLFLFGSPGMCRSDASQAFIQGHGRGGGEIQGADIPGDGDVVGLLRVHGQDGVGEPPGFRSENEKHSFR